MPKQNWIPSLTGRVDPVVEQAIRYLYQFAYSLRDKVDGSPSQAPNAQTQTQPKSPPNVNGYPGLLSQPQKALAVPVDTKPTIHDIVTRAGAIILYNPTNSVYVYDPTTNTFRLLGTLTTDL